MDDAVLETGKDSPSGTMGWGNIVPTDQQLGLISAAEVSRIQHSSKPSSWLNISTVLGCEHSTYWAADFHIQCCVRASSCLGLPKSCQSLWTKIPVFNLVDPALEPGWPFGVLWVTSPTQPHPKGPHHRQAGAGAMGTTLSQLILNGGVFWEGRNSRKQCSNFPWADSSLLRGSPMLGPKNYTQRYVTYLFKAEIGQEMAIKHTFWIKGGRFMALLRIWVISFCIPQAGIP